VLPRDRTRGAVEKREPARVAHAGENWIVDMAKSLPRTS